MNISSNIGPVKKLGPHEEVPAAHLAGPRVTAEGWVKKER